MKLPGLADVLRALPPGSRPLVDALLALARADGRAIYLVGGPVRDLLLGGALRDVDLIVEPKDGEGASELAERLAVPGLRVVRHGRFGTVRLEHEGAHLDLATTRSETYAHPGALPSVAPGGLCEDLRRRDFSVNALAIPLSAGARRGAGPLIDPGTGRADLERRLLRVFHKRSFHDDPTRAQRAARLGVRLGFSLSRTSRSALRDALRDGAFGHVSGERLRREFEKIFEEATLGLDPARVLHVLSGWHVLGALEPGLTLPRAVAAPLRRLGRTLAEPAWPVGRRRPWVAGLSVWLAPLAPALRARVLRRLAVRGEVAQAVSGFPRQSGTLLRSLARARGRGAVDALLGGVDDEALLALHAWAPVAERRRIARYAQQDRQRRAPLRGDDLVALGLAGPAVGRVLARVRMAFLDGSVKNREEALALAREVARGRAALSRPARRRR